MELPRKGDLRPQRLKNKLAVKPSERRRLNEGKYEYVCLEVKIVDGGRGQDRIESAHLCLCVADALSRRLRCQPIRDEPERKLCVQFLPNPAGILVKEHYLHLQGQHKYLYCRQLWRLHRGV